MIVSLRTAAITRDIDKIVDRILRCSADEVWTLQTALREADQAIMRELARRRRSHPRWSDDEDAQHLLEIEGRTSRERILDDDGADDVGAAIADQIFCDDPGSCA